jgi:uncharacterized paraquat-inducible protein A
MNEPLLEKIGGQRVCRVCGYIEREVYRLFCPRCMQRDRLSTLIAAEDSIALASFSKDPPVVEPVRSVSM